MSECVCVGVGVSEGGREVGREGTKEGGKESGCDGEREGGRNRQKKRKVE